MSHSFDFGDGNRVVFSKSVYDPKKITMTVYRKVYKNHGLRQETEIDSFEFDYQMVEMLSRYFTGWVDEVKNKNS